MLGIAGYFIGQKACCTVWPSLSIATNEALMFTALAVGATSALPVLRFLLMPREDPFLGRCLRAVGWFAAIGIALAWTPPGHPTLIFFSLFGTAVMEAIPGVRHPRTVPPLPAGAGCCCWRGGAGAGAAVFILASQRLVAASLPDLLRFPARLGHRVTPAFAGATASACCGASARACSTNRPGCTA
ncbi:hypothetical protein DSL92_04005 [Billgrantia gudaonensis]|uniref:Uncharacterized protein n=1 Tax=Billgrantia gudaonensis TaxID=376427 RepID=A0A3S0QG13_9GAMM|nr:hypothetical protein DSL92_04005 [Halomonas gudaonensis]